MLPAGGAPALQHHNDMTAQELFDSLEKSFGDKLEHRTEFRGETTYAIQESDLPEIAKFCRDKLSFDYLLDITSIDNFGSPREITAHDNLLLRVHSLNEHTSGWLRSYLTG